MNFLKCDRRTDGRTDGQTDSDAICNAICTGGLKKNEKKTSIHAKSVMTLVKGSKFVFKEE